MNKNRQSTKHDIDQDLYEGIDEAEMYELVQKARREALAKEANEKVDINRKRPFPKWMFWLIALALVSNAIALLPQTFSIPAIDFLKVSAKLSTQEDIAAFKEAVVVVATEDSRGTGFSISEDGLFITNYHVIEGKEKVTIVFPEHGIFTAEVISTHPEIDMAILAATGEHLPYLQLAKKTTFLSDERIVFIGNPLRFQGIANEGTIIDYIKLKNWNKEVIMIKAPVYRGNSGSPVINEAGQVIGVIFATLNHEEHGKVGLFVPIDYYYDFVENGLQ